MALTVTGTGGLCMLAGMLVLGHIVGSYDLDTVLASATKIQAHPLYLTALVLILMGALTKSAQFPFQFWLPRAMAAPTPCRRTCTRPPWSRRGFFAGTAVAGAQRHRALVLAGGRCGLVHRC